jgi:uncharacterized short protein YbdD (DUF466 family)
MEAILKFNLPEDREDFEMAVNAGKISALLFDYDQWLRSQIKYAPDEMSQEKLEAFEECRETLHTMLKEGNLLSILF